MSININYVRIFSMVAVIVIQHGVVRASDDAQTVSRSLIKTQGAPKNLSRRVIFKAIEDGAIIETSYHRGPREAEEILQQPRRPLPKRSRIMMIPIDVTQSVSHQNSDSDDAADYPVFAAFQNTPALPDDSQDSVKTYLQKTMEAPKSVALADNAPKTLEQYASGWLGKPSATFTIQSRADRGLRDFDSDFDQKVAQADQQALKQLRDMRHKTMMPIIAGDPELGSWKLIKSGELWSVKDPGGTVFLAPIEIMDRYAREPEDFERARAWMSELDQSMKRLYVPLKSGLQVYKVIPVYQPGSEIENSYRFDRIVTDGTGYWRISSQLFDPISHDLTDQGLADFNVMQHRDTHDFTSAHVQGATLHRYNDRSEIEIVDHIW